MLYTLKGSRKEARNDHSSNSTSDERLGVLSDSFQSHHNQDWEKGQCQEQPDLLQH